MHVKVKSMYFRYTLLVADYMKFEDQAPVHVKTFKQLDSKL